MLYCVVEHSVVECSTGEVGVGGVVGVGVDEGSVGDGDGTGREDRVRVG